MLTVLQYLALIAAFFIPWTIGSAVKFHKEQDSRKRNYCIILAVVCALLLVSVIVLALGINQTIE